MRQRGRRQRGRKGRGNKGTSGSEARLAKKVNSALSMNVRDELSSIRNKPRGKVILPCKDCNSLAVSERASYRGWWAPFCFSCWELRGKPTGEESKQIVAALEAKEQDERELKRQRRIESGEAPW